MSNLGAKVQAKINGTWTDVTRYDANTKILTDAGVQITRGVGNVQDRTPAGTCTWTWQDPNGVYNNENPRSPYYGVLPRNTPVRVYVPRTTPSLLIVDVNDGARCSCPDKAPLDITGDIDIRIDIEPRWWRRFGSNSSRRMLLCGKNGATPLRSWYLRMTETGFLEFAWSTTGSDSHLVTATAALPTAGRIAIRLTVDVDDGAGHGVSTFYTAPTISGSWTQLGATITGGVTSFFNTSVGIELGTTNNGALDGVFAALIDNYVGRIYGFELRSGIAGSLVAQADFTAQTTGATTFADGLGNTWTTSGVAEITNADYRFYGELSAPVQTANISANGVGKDVQVVVNAGGIIRRLTNNATPLQSPIYRNFNTYAANGWWPCEDSSGNSGANTISSAVPGSDAAPITDITIGGFDSTLAGSGGTITLGGTGPSFTGVAKAVVSTTETHFIAYFKFPSIPLSAQTLFTIYGDGTVKRWEFVVDNINYTLKGFDVTGTQTVTKQTTFGTGADPTNWIAYHLQLTNSAGTIGIKSEWHVIGSDIFLSQNATGTLSYAGANGIFTKVVVQGVAALSSVKLAHIMVTTQVGLLFFSNNLTFAKFSRGFAGEAADARFIRVCTEQGIQPVVVGALGNSELMGPQPIDTVMNILYEIQDVDAGRLSETRDQLALEYRTRTNLINQYAQLALSYTVTKHLSDRLQSTPDDTNIANDITVTRNNGGSARVIQTSGPMSVQAPPNGIGTVPDTPTINNYLDARLPYLAEFMLLRRAWPEARYPQVVIDLHRPEFTATTLLQAQILNLGDLFTISNLPQFMPPDPLNLMVLGMTESISGFLWNMTMNTSAYGPYRANELSTVSGEELRADSTRDANYVCQTQLAAAVNTTATSLSVQTLSGVVMPTTAGDPGQFPFDIFIGGERMTVTAIVGATSPQTLTVTRSINGIVSTQVINAPVTAVQYFYATL